MQDALWILAAVIFVLIALAGAVVMASRLRTIIGYGGAPFVASSKATLEHAFALAEIKPTDRVADLGSGDGLVLFEAIKAGAAEAVGYEVDPFLVWSSRREIKKRGLENKIRVEHRDLWRVNLKYYDVIFLFQIPYAMKRLEHKLQLELKPGATVISNSFAFPTWKPVRTDGKQIFVYEKGAD
jgi:hypothetical protein